MSDINAHQAVEQSQSIQNDHHISTNSQEQYINSPFRSSAPSSTTAKSAPTLHDETLDPMFFHSLPTNLIKSEYKRNDDVLVDPIQLYGAAGISVNINNHQLNARQVALALAAAAKASRSSTKIENQMMERKGTKDSERLSDSHKRFSTSEEKRVSSLARSPPLPPDSMISAEEVIRESQVSARYSSLTPRSSRASSVTSVSQGDGYISSSSRADPELLEAISGMAPVSTPNTSSIGPPPAHARSYSFSSRSTFRRSTISETMLEKPELFEPERELSVRELSEVLLNATAQEQEPSELESKLSKSKIKSRPGSQKRVQPLHPGHKRTQSSQSINLNHSLRSSSSSLNSTASRPGSALDVKVASIKDEKQDQKAQYAKSRWTQQVKLKARNFLLTTITLHNRGVVPASPINKDTPTPNCTSADSPTQATSLTTPFAAAINVSSTATPTLKKWNRWMQNHFPSPQLNMPKHNMNLGGFMTLNNNRDVPTPATPGTLISIEEIVQNPRMMRYYAAWLHTPQDQSKLFFLCSFEEYRQFCCTLRSSSAQYEDNEEDSKLLHTYGLKIARKYLSRSAPFHVGADLNLQNTHVLSVIKSDLNNGGDSARRAFDHVEMMVKKALMRRFPEFRNTQLYAEMRESVEREVICLEDILMNHRFANFFWIFLFPHNYHREIGLWLDVEYEFKPAYRRFKNILARSSKVSEDEGMSKKNSGVMLEHSSNESRCWELLVYISEKYFAGQDVLSPDSLQESYIRLQEEQDNIIAKFQHIHLELYHRFITSKAYAEFCLYPPRTDANSLMQSMDDLRRLSALLLSYGLRAHYWPVEFNREIRQSTTLRCLQCNNGSEGITGVVSFDTVPTISDDKLTLRLQQYPLSNDAAFEVVDKALEQFILPWCNDPFNVARTGVVCPEPQAFNFCMGNTSSNNGQDQLYGACMVIYKPAPIGYGITSEKWNLGEDLSTCSIRWIPYGICLLSRFPLLDALRVRLAECYEQLLVPTLSTENSSQSKIFQLDSNLVIHLSRPVEIALPGKTIPREGILKSKATLKDRGWSWDALDLDSDSTSDLSEIPILDHSIQMLFEILDPSTVLFLFAAILLEHRLVFISSYYSVLMSTIEALKGLMYPLVWPHIYLPILPQRMMNYLECPTPFVFGVERRAWEGYIQDTQEEDIPADSTMDDFRESMVCQGMIEPESPTTTGSNDRSSLNGNDLLYGADLDVDDDEDLIVVDLDYGRIIRSGSLTGSSTVVEIPERIALDFRRSLARLLKPNLCHSDHIFASSYPMRSIGKDFPEIGVRKLFFRTVRKLLGDFGYHRYVWKDAYSQKEVVFFDEASYLAASAPETREFRTLLIATQAFSEFIVAFHGFEEKIEQWKQHAVKLQKQ